MRNHLSRRCHLVLASMVVIGSGASYGRAATHAVNNLAEIKAALRGAEPGDDIVMRSGDWRDVRIRFEAQGRPDASITLRAQQLGRTILRGRSRLDIVGQHLVVDGLVFTDGHLQGEHVVRFGDGRTRSHHCRLTNTSIIAYNPPDRSTKYFWVAVDGTRHRIDHCFFSRMNHEGVVIKVEAGPTPGDHRIDHNYFGHRPPGGRNGFETMRIGNSTTSMFVSRTVVEYNYFEKCDGEHEIISSKCCENVYRYNTFVDCAGLLTLRHGNRCRVEGNFFLGRGNSKMGGVRVMGEDHRIINNVFVGLRAEAYYGAVSFMNGIPDSPLNGYFQVKNCLVAFNTFINNKWIFNCGGNRAAATLAPRDCRIANNLFIGPDSRFANFTSRPQNWRLEGNWAFDVEFEGSPPPGIRIEDPRLLSAPDVDWRLSTQSPAVGGAAGHFPFVTLDVDGQPRPGRRAKTVGADEPSTAPITNRPLTPNDVGPITTR